MRWVIGTAAIFSNGDLRATGTVATASTYKSASQKARELRCVSHPFLLTCASLVVPYADGSIAIGIGAHDNGAERLAEMSLEDFAYRAEGRTGCGCS
jgi:hypothetical protein